MTGAVELVELGSGTAAKTRVLLDAMQQAGMLERYVPVDVTESMVRECAQRADRRVSRAAGAWRDRRLRAPPRAHPPGRGPADHRLPRGHDRQFPSRQPPQVPARYPRLLGPDDHLLMGTDLVKEPGVLEAAYDDSQGVTAAFNRNVLHVLNRELRRRLRPRGLRPRRVVRRENEWIEMRLRARARGTRRVVRELDLARAFRRRRGTAHGDQREVHARAPARATSLPPGSSSCAGSPIRMSCSR